MIRFLLSVLFCLSVMAASAQTPLADSLKREVVLAIDDGVRLQRLINLLEHANNLPADSAWAYVIKTKALASKLKNSRGYSLAIVAEAAVYLRWGHQDSARALVEPELAKYKVGNAGTREEYFSLAQRMVDCVDHDDNYKAAMPLVFSILKDAEKYKDSLVAANCMNTLAAWYYDLDFLPESRSWSYKAIAYCPPNDPRFREMTIGINMVLGDNYRWIRQFDSAGLYLNRCLELARKSQDLYWIGSAWQRMCGLYLFEKQFDKAEAAIRESSRLAEQIEGRVPQPEQWMFLAAVYERSGRVDDAIKVMTDGLKADTLYRNHSPHVKKDNGETDMSAVNYYSELAKCYLLKKDYKSYSETLEKIIDGNSAVYKVNEANAVAGYQTKYEVEKKEATIARQQLTLTRDRYFFWGIVAFAALGVIFMLLILRESRLRQLAKMKRLQEDEKRLAQAAVASAEENERKRIAADLHDNLGAQLSFIKRNVNFIIDQPEGFNRSDEKRYLGYVNDIAQTAMIDLRETLWVLNKEEVTIQEFADKLKSYLRQQLLDKDQIVWEFQEQIDRNWTLASGEVMHLFRIVQELISNGIKHSGAGRIDIRFASDAEGCYELQISDNGKGFDVNEVPQGHYGLENIQQRAKEIGAVLSMESDPGAGTRVVLTKKK